MRVGKQNENVWWGFFGQIFIIKKKKKLFTWTLDFFFFLLMGVRRSSRAALPAFIFVV